MRRKKGLVWAMLAVVCILTAPSVAGDTAASEEADFIEDDLYYMEPDKEYIFDLDGDGEAERICYETMTDETEAEIRGTKGVLKIYQNNKLLYTMIGNGGTYDWAVSRCTMPTGKTYLLAYTRSDNDWTDQAFLLSQKDEDSLTVEGELCDLTRENEESEKSFLSGWARLNWKPVEAVSEDRITLVWCETLNVTGIVYIPIEYRITDEGIKVMEPPYLLDREKNWTAHRGFNTIKEPGSKETAFRVKAEDVVKLTEITAVDGSFYLKCENEAGETGWLRDSEEISYDQKNGIWGYFKEAVFAG